MTAWVFAVPDRHRRFLVLKVHLDDSGEKKEPFVTLAGFVGIAPEWSRFEVEARTLFDAYGIRYLHTVDMHHRRGQFELWSRARIREFTSTFFDLLASRVEIATEFSVAKGRFAERKQALGLKKEGAAITFCLKGMISRMYQRPGFKQLLEETGADVSFVIEAGNKHDNALMQAFNEMRPHYPALRSLVFEDKQKLIALQAADFMAYWTRRLRVKDPDHPRFKDEYNFFAANVNKMPVTDLFCATDFYGGSEPGPPA